VCQSDSRFGSIVRKGTKMKIIIFLTALVALAAAFDFPEDWEAWKAVNWLAREIMRAAFQCAVILTSTGVQQGLPGRDY